MILIIDFVKYGFGFLVLGVSLWFLLVLEFDGVLYIISEFYGWKDLKDVLIRVISLLELFVFSNWRDGLNEYYFRKNKKYVLYLIDFIIKCLLKFVKEL